MGVPSLSERPQQGDGSPAGEHHDATSFARRVLDEQPGRQNNVAARTGTDHSLSSRWAAFKDIAMRPVDGLGNATVAAREWVAEHRKTTVVGTAILAMVSLGADTCEGPAPSTIVPSKTCAKIVTAPFFSGVEGRSEAPQRPGIENASTSGYSRLLYDADVKTAAPDAGDCPAEWDARTSLYGTTNKPAQGSTQARLHELVLDTQVRPTSAPDISCPGTVIPGVGKAIKATVADLTTGRSETATLELITDHSNSHDCYYHGYVGTKATEGLKVTRGDQVITQVPADTATATGAIVPDGKQQMLVLDSDDRTTTSTSYR